MDIELHGKTFSIDTVITDVDGVLTDGGTYYTVDGKVMKKFGPHDSDGVKILMEMGIHVEAVTADRRGYGISKARTDDMGIPLTLIADGGRLNWVAENFNPDSTIFIGDGIHDVPTLKRVAVGMVPGDATIEASSAADIVLMCSGGDGVLLEVANFVRKHAKAN